MGDVYVGLEVLATVEGDYLVRISKDELNTLVTFDDRLILRHWDGEKPVVLEPYGEDAVRTKEDANSTNNLTELPEVATTALRSFLG